VSYAYPNLFGVTPKERRHGPSREVNDILREVHARCMRPLLDACCAENLTTPEVAMSAARHRCAARARHAFWLALRGLGLSYPEIAKLCGVDHTTVMGALKGRKQRIEA